MIKMKKKIIGIFICMLLISTALPVAINANFDNKKIAEMMKQEVHSDSIEYDEIIKQGLHLLDNWKGIGSQAIHSTCEYHEYVSLLKRLEKRYTSHSCVEFASLAGTTMTVKFKDSFYTLILDSNPAAFSQASRKKNLFSRCFSLLMLDSLEFVNLPGGNAVVLNPFEFQAAEMINNSSFTNGSLIRALLKNNGYTVTYKENDEVDIDFIKSNLSANIVFHGGHGGYWDLDGDEIPDTVVIVSGENWTAETPSKYQFEYENGWLVRVTSRFGSTWRSLIGYTPDLITYYYNNSFPDNALVFMATCDSMKDISLAQAFVGYGGAATFMGWSNLVKVLHNGIACHMVVFLLCNGWSVKSVCRFISFFMPVHRMQGSRLTYFGEGNLKIVDN